MKKILSLILTVFLLLSAFIPVYAVNEIRAMVGMQIKVFVDDKQVEFDVVPITINDRTMVPLRAIFEALGAEVNWNHITESAIAEREATTIVVAKNSDKMYVNGREIILDCPVCIIDDRTMVPVRAISEAFGLIVDWVAETKTVLIHTSAPVIMGTDAEYQPFEFVKNGEIVGIDVEIGAEIAKELGKELKISDMEIGLLSDALQTDKIDFAVSRLTSTDERKSEVDFSDPYYTATQAILVPSRSNIDDADDIKNKKVGVVKGWTGEIICKEELGFTNVVTYKSVAEAIGDMKKSWLDAIVIDRQMAEMQVAANKGYVNGNFKVVDDPVFTDEEYCIAVKKGNTELLAAVNKVIAELKTTGKINDLVAKY